VIGPPAGTKVYLAAGVTDMRKGFEGLAAFVQQHLKRFRSVARSMRSGAGAAILSSCCGGTGKGWCSMPSVWNAVASLGSRPPRGLRC
jgi:IS66 Orf2 like protein